MSIEDARLGRLRVYIEPNGSYAVDNTSNLSGDFVDVPYVEGSAQTNNGLSWLDPQTTKQYLDSYDEKIAGPKSCTLSFDALLSPPTTSLTGNGAPITESTWWLARLLKTIMGSLTAPATSGATTEVQSGTTSTVVNVTTGHGVRFSKGTGIGCVVNGRYEYREVLSVSTDAVSVKVAFSGTPTTSSTVRASYTFALTENPDASLQLVLEGAEAYNRFAFLGLQGGFSLDVTTGQLPKISFALTGASWMKLSNAALAAASITNFKPSASFNSEFIAATVGSTTRTVVHAQGETWTPGITYEPVSSSSGVETIARMRRVRNRAVSGQFNPYFDSSGLDWHALAAARTKLAMFKQIGSSTSEGGVLLSAPTVQILTPQRAQNGNLDALQVQWEGRHDEAVASPTTDFHRSAFRIHLF